LDLFYSQTVVFSDDNDEVEDVYRYFDNRSENCVIFDSYEPSKIETIQDILETGVEF